jgi:Na+-driven multidrug efflux pump
MLAKVISRLFTWGGAIALFFKLIFMFGGYLILKRLTNEPVTIRATGTYIYWVVLVSVLLLQPLSGKGFMWAPQPQKPGEMGLWY